VATVRNFMRLIIGVFRLINLRGLSITISFQGKYYLFSNNHSILFTLALQVRP
jgi:hypothetical protein